MLYRICTGQQGIDSNPASNYAYLPNHCKLVNGAGLTVLIASMFVYIAVMQRHSALREVARERERERERKGGKERRKEFGEYLEGV